MEENIKLLIKLLEKESHHLQQYMKACVKDYDYKRAHIYQRALSNISRQLQTLQNLEDPYFDEKRYLLNIIQRLKTRLATERSEGMNAYLVSELEDYERELKTINQRSIQKPPAPEISIFDSAFHSLAQKQIVGFDLMLSKSENFLFKFTYSKKAFVVSIPLITKGKRPYFFSEKLLHSLTVLGFSSPEGENKMVLALTGNPEAALAQIKFILSKVVFDHFYFREFENDSFIIIHEKQSLRKT